MHIHAVVLQTLAVQYNISHSTTFMKVANFGQVSNPQKTHIARPDTYIHIYMYIYIYIYTVVLWTPIKCGAIYHDIANSTTLKVTNFGQISSSWKIPIARPGGRAMSIFIQNGCLQVHCRTLAQKISAYEVCTIWRIPIAAGKIHCQSPRRGWLNPRSLTKIYN